MILPNAALLEEEKNRLWQVMYLQRKYDSKEEMWGFEDGETLENVIYSGQSLAS